MHPSPGLAFSTTPRTTGFPEVNTAIHFCYVCHATIQWPFKIASKFEIAMGPFDFQFLDFLFWMCAIHFCNCRIHVNAAIAIVNIGC